ncbi:unnamed protein product [Prunus armeniaca]
MHKWSLRQWNVKNAFLHGELEEEVFTRQLQGSNAQLVQTVIDDLGAVFEMKEYAKDLLHKAGLSNCRACPTPCKPHNQVLKSEGEPLHDPTFYRSIVGALQYLTFTRPDLSYVVNTVYQYMTAPIEIHFNRVKRILRYVQGTMNYGFTLLMSKKQGSVFRSSTKAEYRALANTAADLAWIRQYVPTQEQIADVFTKGLHGPIFLSHCISMPLGNPEQDPELVDSLTKMQNEEGSHSSATNRWITSKDHASFQINVGHLDENGIYTGQFSTFALCGYVRALVLLLTLISVLVHDMPGDADSGLDRLWQKKKAEVKRH